MKKNGKSQAAVRCKVSRGMFSTERGVVITLADGRRVLLFVDMNLVVPQANPSPDEEVDGKLKVSVVQVRKRSVIVDLPQPGLTEGPRLEISKDEIIAV